MGILNVVYHRVFLLPIKTCLSLAQLAKILLDQTFINLILNDLIRISAYNRRRDNHAGLWVSKPNDLLVVGQLKSVREGVQQLRHDHVLLD